MKSDPNITLHYLRKRPVMLAWWIFHRLTSAWRAVPGFIIVGVQKGGTTSLFQYLSRHPNMLPPFRKEIKYFDFNYTLGMGWYQANFPLRKKLAGNNAITGDASPNYIFHPDGAIRIAQSLPATRIIALLRNPVDRAYSHYHRMVEEGLEDLSFEGAIEAEEERLGQEAMRVNADGIRPRDEYFNHSYLARGRYIEQVPGLFEAFPRENILLLKSEDLFTRTAEIYHETLAFLGLPQLDLPRYKASNQRRNEPMNKKTRKKLVDYFARFNENLYQYLHRDFGWE